MANASEKKNKRKFPRADIRISLEGKGLRGREGISIRTVTRNISAGGVRFTHDKFISLACRLVIELHLPDISEPIRAVSKVAWIKKHADSDEFDIGNQFLEMSKDDKEAISNFVDSNL